MSALKNIPICKMRIIQESW